MSDYDRNSPLTVEQQQRTASLDAAKNLLSAYSKPVDPGHLIAVAEWIIEPESRRRRMGALLRDFPAASDYTNPTPTPARDQDDQEVTA